MRRPTMTSHTTTQIFQLSWGDLAEATDDDDRRTVSVEMHVPVEEEMSPDRLEPDGDRSEIVQLR